MQRIEKGSHIIDLVESPTGKNKPLDRFKGDDVH